MALFDYIPRSNKNLLNEDDFIVNEFDAGNNNDDENEDDIQGLDDSEVDDEENDNNSSADDTTPDVQSDDNNGEPLNNEDTGNGVDTQDDEIEGLDDSEINDGSDGDNNDDSSDTQDTSSNDTLDSGDTPTDDNSGDDELDTIDDDSDGMGDTGDNIDNSSDGGDSGDNLEGNDSLDSSENDPHQRLKELENEIFDQLSEPEKQMKINELKKLYGVLIDKADSLYKLTQEISKTDDTVRMIDYTLNTLLDLKTYLKDYVIDVYDNRTYLQNSVNFQKFLTIFDAIHAIFKEIKKQLEIDDKC